jgi:hypothetical protein
VLILAASKDQAKRVHDYALAFLTASPVLRKLVLEVTVGEIRLTNGVIIATHSNSYRTVRGRTLLACVFDEVAFWRDEGSTQPDTETYRAVLPSLATTSGLLAGISSPYRKVGLLFKKWHDHFGKDDPRVLVVQADTATFNPTINADVIESATEDDPEAARSEWGGEWRSDLATFVDEAAIRGCVDAGVLERPPVAHLWGYHAFRGRGWWLRQGQHDHGHQPHGWCQAGA